MRPAKLTGPAPHLSGHGGHVLLWWILLAAVALAILLMPRPAHGILRSIIEAFRG